MGKLFNAIRQLVAAEEYIVGQHASERMEERGIMEWQVVEALDDGELIAERPNAKPNPAVEVRNACRMARNSKRYGPPPGPPSSGLPDLHSGESQRANWPSYIHPPRLKNESH